MRVLLTGGAGFIGSVVGDFLRADGHDVVVLDRAVDARDDVTDLDRVRSTLVGCQAIVHLAAKVGLGVDISDIDDYVRQNDLGTAIVLRAAAEAGVSRIVYASSMVVYGEGTYSCRSHGAVMPPPRSAADLAEGRFDPVCPACGSALASGPVPESARLDPRNVYAATKAHGEQLARSGAERPRGRRRAALPQRLRTGHAPAHPVRGRRIAVPRRPRTETTGRGIRRRPAATQLRSCDRRRPSRGRRGDRRSPRRTHACEHRLTDDYDDRGDGPGDHARTGGPDPVITGRYRLGDVRHITADCAFAERVLGWRAEVDLDAGIRSFITASDDRSPAPPHMRASS